MFVVQCALVRRHGWNLVLNHGTGIGFATTPRHQTLKMACSRTTLEGQHVMVMELIVAVIVDIAGDAVWEHLVEDSENGNNVLWRNSKCTEVRKMGKKQGVKSCVLVTR